MAHIPETADIYEALALVHDPEIPVLNVLELGMITGVDAGVAGVRIHMIPTFAACPAVEYIRRGIRDTLEARFGVPVSVFLDLSQHWTSDRLSASARQKLHDFRIAPPALLSAGGWEQEALSGVPCPHCGSTLTYLRSPFGSTLCRALHYCRDCGQVFEHFKPVD